MTFWTWGNPHHKETIRDLYTGETEVRFSFTDTFLESYPRQAHITHHIYKMSDYESKPAGKWRKFGR